jgi:GNAT superfamily N-acetyltransferase
MSVLKIRELDAETPDFDTVTAWLTDAFGYLDGSDLAETRRWARAVIAAPHEAIFAAHAGASLVGTVSVVGSDLAGHEHLTPWLASLYVSAPARGRGYGIELVRAATAWARARGAERLHLYANRGRVSGFYERLGWRYLADVGIEGERHAIMTFDI